MARPSLETISAFSASRMIGADLPGGALGGLQRDVAGKALGDDHVDGALADVVALDEAVVDEARAAGRREDPRRFLDLVEPLHLLGADVEQAHRRQVLVEQRAGQRRAENGEVGRAAWRRRRPWRPRPAR